jgi:hypothetical protein
MNIIFEFFGKIISAIIMLVINGLLRVFRLNKRG